MALDTVFKAISLALSQLGDPRFRRVLLLGVGGAVTLLIAFTWCLSVLVGWLTGDSISLPFVGEIQWLDNVFSWGAVVLALLLSVFLMVPVASAITSLFLDDVADAVEAVHYPNIAQQPRTPFGEALRDTFGFLGVIVIVNLLALVLYVIFAPIALFIFWTVNGFLLGREYFMLVAMRRVGRKRAKELRRKHFLTVWVAGILMAMPLSIPLLNLVIPILGAATFTHLFQLLPQEHRGPPNPPDYRR
ncbi:EI24 domain-containing protein [uncultured Sulfitobacter sp.]|uniref:EI24 domain-containing protein n=1 Tax=uncultured Sulfitobacter sp. TaxID=191468 RepID=UPI002601F2F7|nr:EI24 domain-containing protein [uncultured Sulfitobacter sp.]